MLRQSIAFEWQIGDDIEWQENNFVDDALALRPSISETTLAMALGRGIALLAAALFLTGSIAIPANLLAQRQADRAIRFALAQERLLRDAGSQANYAALIDGEIARQWQNHWRTAWKRSIDEQSAAEMTLLAVNHEDDLAVATVLVRNPAPEWGESSSFREQRYYRLRGQQWLRTVPGAAYWGERQTKETEYFLLEYYRPDSGAIEVIIPRLDQIYSELYHRLGIAVPSHKPKQTFAVVPEMINNWRAYNNRVEFTSPALAPIPAPLANDEYLLQVISQRLSYLAIQEAMARTRNGTEYRWSLVLWGVRSWLVQDLLQQRTPWSLEAADALRTMLVEQPEIALTMLNRNYNSEQPNADELMARYQLAESVIAYSMTTYGLEHLPIIMQDFSIYSRWDDLIPQVFGISAEEFEAGWRAYVQTTYNAASGS